MCGYPITHVVHALPSGATARPGQNRTPDEDIGQWCAQNEYVLVTADEDFRGHWVRGDLFTRHGVEVIAFDRDLPGLRNQHERITRHFSWWETTLAPSPYGPRLWIQRKPLQPVLDRRAGRTRRPRSRGPGTPT